MTHPDILRAEREGGPLANGVWPTEQKLEEPLICPRTEKEIDEDDLETCDFCEKRFCKDCFFAAKEAGGGFNIKKSGINACYECMETDREAVQVAVLLSLSLRAARTGSFGDLQHYMAVRREYKENEQ